MLMLVLFVTGCATETRVVRDGWGPLRDLQDNQQRDRGGAKAQEYAILLRSFEGDKRLAEAKDLLLRLQREAGWHDVWLDKRDDKVLALRGHYPMPDVDDATRNLSQSRDLMLDGQQVFAEARVISLSGPGGEGQGDTQKATTNPWDAAQFVGMYTLQIGFYDEAFGPTFRKAAEEAVKVLRGDGEQAYFYHGPNRSLITLNLFTDDDFGLENKVTAYGPAMRALQERFPYNLANGVTIIETRRGVRTEQPSFIVQVR